MTYFAINNRSYWTIMPIDEGADWHCHCLPLSPKPLSEHTYVGS